MFRWLPVFTVSLFVLVALAAPVTQAGPVEIDENCTAQFAQTASPGGHANAWGSFGVLDFHLAGPLDQQRSWTLKGLTPINVGGTAEADGTLSGFGFGTYDGIPLFVGFDGHISFYDPFGEIFNGPSNTFPRVVNGTYTIGTNGELAGGQATEITTYCVFDPPLSIADPDNDSILSTVIVPGQLNVDGTGVLAAGQNNLRLRLQAGGVQDITLGNVSDFSIEFEKFGPANAIVENSYNRRRTEFIGTFNPFSIVNTNLPLELSDSVVQSTISGGYTSLVKTDAAATTVLHDYSWSIGRGDPIALLNGSETTGQWTWNTMSINAITDFNAITGISNATVTTEFRSQNLAVAPSGTGPQGTALGDPLRFDENITAQFFPNVIPVVDNCPDVANPGQEDSDLDGNGDACDGLVWLDGNCSGLVDARDMLRTLLAASNVAVDPAPNCPQLGDAWGQRIGGDWDCNTTVNAADILYGLKEIGGVADPVPAGCPAPGELIPE